MLPNPFCGRNRNPDSDPYLLFIKEKYSDKPFTFWFDKLPKNKEQLELNPYNFLMLSEPDEFFGMHSWVKQNAHLFTGILTWNEELLNTLPNAILFHHVGEGGCGMIENNYIETFNEEYPEKSFCVSFLSGAKTLVEGHKLRQEIYKIEDKINIPKKWFYTLNDFNRFF